MITTAQKLERARKRMAELDTAWDRTGLPKDPGALSGVAGWTRERQAKDIRRSTRIASEAVALEREIKALEHKLRTEQREAEIRADAHCDIDSLKPGDLIRYEKHGSVINNVGRVVRVNAKTVTIDAPPHFDKPKIPKERIIETQSAQEEAV